VRARINARPHVAAAVLYAALALVFVGPGLVPGRTLSNSDSFFFKAPWAAGKPTKLVRQSNPEFDDAPAQIQPFVLYTKRHLPDIPLWNPHIMTGRPFEANAQSAIFSPFNLLAYALPFWTALGLIAALKLWLASFGTFLLGRALGMRIPGALLAGVTYGFSLWLVAWLSYPHASVWALIPLILVATDRLIRRPTVRGAAPLVALTGAQLLCGHPESSFHAGLASAIFFAIRLRGSRLPWRAPVGAFAAAMVAGLALAAVAVVPFAELLLRSADLRQRSGTAIGTRAERRFVLEAFMPDWHGRPTQAPQELFLLARAWYGGALALMLAAAALVLRPSRGRLITAALGLSAMMVVFGVPPVFDIVVRLPPFSSGHNGRLAILALLCLALLAGWGLDDLLARTGSRRRRDLALGAAGVLFLFPFAYALLRGRTTLAALDEGLRVAWGFVDPGGPAGPDQGDIVRASALWIWLGVAGVGLAIVTLAVRGGRRAGAGALAAAAVALAFGDLARAGMGYNPAIDRDAAVQPDTPAIRVLHTANPARFVATGDIPQGALPFNHDLYEARGYDLPVERRYDRLWRSRLSPEFASQVGPYPQNIPLSLPRVTPYRLGVLGTLGTRYIIQPLGDPALRVPGLTLVHRGPDARVYRNAREQPRAAVVDAQQVAPDDEAALTAMAAPGFRIDGTVVTERAISGLAQVRRTPGQAARPPAGHARITEVEPDRLTVRARADRTGMLVVSDAWAPGWKAEVDGRSADVQRVNYVMRGVRVGAGDHEVVLRYQPWSWRIGWIVSLASLLALVAALGLTWRRRP